MFGIYIYILYIHSFAQVQHLCPRLPVRLEGRVGIPAQNGVTCFNVQQFNIFSGSATVFAGLRFTVCDICEQLKSQLHDKQVPLSEKLGAVTQYRRHLKDQYNDRSILWTLCDVANSREGDILLLWLDGMEQAKFQVPRDRGLRTASSTSRPQV